MTGHLRRTVGVALPLLGLLASGCGRLGFETITDGGETDVDAGLRDAAMLDAAMVDAWRADDAGHDAATSPDASCVPVSSSCNEVHRLPAAPTIDGVIEPCLALNALTPAGWTGSMALPAAIHARAAYAWRPDGIYVYVEVDDPDRHPASMPDDPYCGDAVEAYVDDDGLFAAAGHYDVPGTIQLIAAAPSSSSGSSSYAGRWVDTGTHVAWTPPRFAMVGRPGGYAFETLVQASELGRASWTLAAGQHVGLDLAVDVSTPDGSLGTSPNSCGSRTGQYFLRIDPTAASCVDPYCDSRAFCTPVLR